MKLRILGAVAVLLLSTSLTQAAWDPNAAAQALLDEGFTRVEIEIGATTAKLEAIKGTTKIEVTYDLATGDILKTETETVEPGDDTAPGVFIETDDSAMSDDDDDEDDDHSGDDEDEDNSGSDDGDDEEDDDHSGSGGGDDDEEDDDDHSGSGGGDDDDGEDEDED